MVLEKRGTMMGRWFSSMRFLWEEPMAPPIEAPPVHGVEPTGVPAPVRRATRFALLGLLSTSLMSQVIGVRLVAPVDAAPSYVAQCIQANCKGLKGKARADCNHRCQEAARGQR
jgi:hypothetical protein